MVRGCAWQAKNRDSKTGDPNSNAAKPTRTDGPRLTNSARVGRRLAKWSLRSSAATSMLAVPQRLGPRRRRTEVRPTKHTGHRGGRAEPARLRARSLMECTVYGKLGVCSKFALASPGVGGRCFPAREVTTYGNVWNVAMEGVGPTSARPRTAPWTRRSMAQLQAVIFNPQQW